MIHVDIKLSLLVVGLLFLGGCTSRAATKIDLCSLVTKEEAAAALGGDVEVTLRPDGKVCAYDLVPAGSGKATRYGSIAVMVVTSDSVEFQKFGVSKDARTAAKPVSGVGERAVIFMSKERPDDGAKAIQALKGNVYVGIGMGTSTTPVSEDVLKTLATKALSRLPAK